MNWVDRLILWFSPSWGRSRVQARVLARHFEAASVGRRTSGWSRTSTDANQAAAGATLARLRWQARDLVRNNPWARRALRRIVTNTVGWGIKPKAAGASATRVAEIFKRWGETTQCDAAGQNTFYGLQSLVMRTVVLSGEALIRRRVRRPEDGLEIPLQLEVLEPDLIDTFKDAIMLPGGGRITQGIEFDAIGRRAAYWLFEQHPGSNLPVAPVSRRIPASEILHVFDLERPGQVRGPSWFASVDVRLHEFDEYEDATLVKQKVAACMTAFVTDLDGAATPLGVADTDSATNKPLDSMEPGLISYLPPGKTVTISNPPQSSDHQSFSAASLRGVAAGIGVTYEDLTGDYSQVNYSSARMARIAHNADVCDWRWNMLIPRFCVPAWQWMLDAIALLGEFVDDAPATWTPPPLPFLDPDKEIQATMKAVRTGQQTPDDMVREQGYDPEEHWNEYAASFKRLDKLGIVLDCDPRKVSSTGQAQAANSAIDETPTAAKPTSNGVPKNGAKTVAATAPDTAS
jgi:lambda family phage portal protein